MEAAGLDLTAMEFWHWFALGGAFLVLEVLTLGFFFLWFGVSAIVIGIVLLVIPSIGWEMQWSLWALLAVVDLFAWRILMKKKLSQDIPTDEPYLNKRGEQYIGRTFTITEPVIDGYGKVKVDDSIWKIESETDMDAGSKVKVIEIDGTILKVEAV